MQRILTAKQMREADLYTINNLGIAKSDLVLRAGSAVTEEIFKRFQGGRVLVCIGKGNNGEDGKVVAKLLCQKHGFNVSLFCVDKDEVSLLNNKYDIIVDCIFGTGLNKNVVGIYKEVINRINASGAFIIACDIPSGLNATTGLAMGICVKADMTIAIQELKTGHFLNDGLDYSGEIIVKDIGISVWEDAFTMRLTDCDVVKFFAKRSRNTHKGNFGKVTIFGGNKNFPGSVSLSMQSLSSLKSGVGYSNLVIPESLYNIYALKHPECTIMTVKDDNGVVIFDKTLLDKLCKYNCIAIGMGCGVSIEIYKTIKYLLKNFHGTLLIDADGLNCLSAYGIEILKKKSCRVVLTPHVGEFSRLSGLSKEEILTNTIESAKNFAKTYNVILVLKSAVSVITDGVCSILNTTGCSGMAKGGSGDALSGFMAGVLARTNCEIEAVASACYVFGRAGEIAQKNDSSYTIIATDVINCLGKAINYLD